ncbi:GFA family protein [Pinisolibacter aquiterrae]|uniref:GFA family protein n=1 Tax=Pinisolibacter aquiterrae TaxID=2815579 RepID=UPI001C3D5030|nr:GFA family protein [Pinisolibacter aquiterrae]MBV5263054.1 GFA family protein [Pinisolibacter aquiterrae]MCC8233970.1 GFA family protein [Pinisolibacter aquiterrae]
MTTLTGGCQCGAVRFRCDDLGRASICHCRMCQKAFGGHYGPLVTAMGLVWTRGEPKRFRSSNEIRRGFCADCGTPLTYEPDGYPHVEVALGAFDAPAEIRPEIQVGVESRMPWFHELATLPGRPPEQQAKAEGFFAEIVSYQHPDHDTAEWPPSATGAE